jgi:5'-nucleotidase
MRVLVDMDGVLCDLVGKVRQFLDITAPTVEWQTPTQYYFADQYPSIIKTRIMVMMLKRGFFQSLDPIPGAIAGIKRLSEAHTVRIVSFPKEGNNHSAVEKMEWVDEWLGPEWVQRMILITDGDKTQVRGDWLLDDNPSISRGSFLPTWGHIMYTQSYNASCEAVNRAVWSTDPDKPGLIYDPSLSILGRNLPGIVNF